MNVRVMLVREGKGKTATVDASSPERVFEYLRPRAAEVDREHVWRLDLSVRHGILGIETVSIGTLTASLIHPREVFTGALLQGTTAGIILCHNHPSGDPSPSKEDRDITRRIVQAGELLGIPLIDHIIITAENFFSFRANALL